jgi:alkylation response protein AidB-like acyl-CoA dehydrogenase
MDLPVPEHVRPIRDKFHDFVVNRIIPVEDQLYTWWKPGDPGGPLMAELRADAKAEGLWAIGHPKEVGGGGLPFMDYVYVNEVVGLSEPAVWVLGQGTLQDTMMLNEYASPEWREKYLGPLVNGDIIQSFGMTEPGVASSDATQLETTAVLDGDEWVINGRKWFTSLANFAKYTTVIARTEANPARPHLAFSAIIVPTDTPGYNIVRSVPVFGDNEGDHCEVEYVDMRVPYSNLLGESGQGFLLGQKRLGPGRISLDALPQRAPLLLFCASARCAASRSAPRSPTSSSSSRWCSRPRPRSVRAATSRSTPPRSSTRAIRRGSRSA